MGRTSRTISLELTCRSKFFCGLVEAAHVSIRHDLHLGWSAFSGSKAKMDLALAGKFSESNDAVFRDFEGQERLGIGFEPSHEEGADRQKPSI